MPTRPKQSRKAQKPKLPPPAERRPVFPYASTLGVYVNEAGEEVDEFGVSVAFKKLREKDTIRWNQALEGVSLQPADLLKAIAMDPRFTINQRMAAAISAAPYFTPKKAPVGEGSGENNIPATPVSVSIVFKDATKKKA